MISYRGAQPSCVRAINVVAQHDAYFHERRLGDEAIYGGAPAPGAPVVPTPLHYTLHEPNVQTKKLCIKKMKRHICRNTTLKEKIIEAFKNSHKCLAECVKPCKLTNAVLNISVRRVLNKLLGNRKHTVEKFSAICQSS